MISWAYLKANNCMCVCMHAIFPRCSCCYSISRPTTACVPACMLYSHDAVAVTVSQGQQHCAYMLYSLPVSDTVVGPETFLQFRLGTRYGYFVARPILQSTIHNYCRKNHCFFTSVGLTHTRLTYVILELERLCSKSLLGSGKYEN